MSSGMSLEFELFDLISLVTIIVGLVATYWKVNSRLMVTEMKVSKLEEDVLTNETKVIEMVRSLDKKLEIKNQLIDNRLQDILIHLSNHRDKSGH